MTTNTFVPFVLYISLHLSPASHSTHFCPLLCFFAPNIAHIFPQMPWADYNSSSALPLSPLTPSRCCVGSVINDIDTALDSWLHRASCWTTYWANTHIHVNKYTLAHTKHKQPKERYDSKYYWVCSIKSLFRGQVLAEPPPPPPSEREQGRALCPWISLELWLAASVPCRKKKTLLVSFYTPSGRTLF